MNIPKTFFHTMFVVALTACNSQPATDASAKLAQVVTESASGPQQVFFDRIAALCGQSFSGSVLIDRPESTGPNAFRDQPLTMHVRECSDQEIRIPFNVGADRSRTWVLTRTGYGLRLKHDHRHEDGSADPVTMYGGDTASNGNPGRQEFPVDGDSKMMFTRKGMTVSNTNVWAMEIEPGHSFVYELARTGQDRLFRVSFDLTKPIPTPPAPWGATQSR